MELGSWRITKVVHFIKELTVSTASCTLIDYHSFSFSYDGIISASSTCTSNLQAHSTSQGSPIDCWPSSDTNPSRLGSHRWQRVKGTLTLPYRVIPVVGTLKLKTVYRNSSIKPAGGIFLSYTFLVGGGLFYLAKRSAILIFKMPSNGKRKWKRSRTWSPHEVLQPVIIGLKECEGRGGGLKREWRPNNFLARALQSGFLFESWGGGGGGWGGATPLQKTVYVHLWSWGLTLSVRRMQTLWAERKTRLAWRLRKRYQTNKRHRCKDIL